MKKVRIVGPSTHRYPLDQIPSVRDWYHNRLYHGGGWLRIAFGQLRF